MWTEAFSCSRCLPGVSKGPRVQGRMPEVTLGAGGASWGAGLREGGLCVDSGFLTGCSPAGPSQGRAPAWQWWGCGGGCKGLRRLPPDFLPCSPHLAGRSQGAGTGCCRGCPEPPRCRFPHAPSQELWLPLAQDALKPPGLRLLPPSFLRSAHRHLARGPEGTEAGPPHQAGVAAQDPMAQAGQGLGQRAISTPIPKSDHRHCLPLASEPPSDHPPSSRAGHCAAVDPSPRQTRCCVGQWLTKPPPPARTHCLGLAWAHCGPHPDWEGAGRDGAWAVMNDTPANKSCLDLCFGPGEAGQQRRLQARGTPQSSLQPPSLALARGTQLPLSSGVAPASRPSGSWQPVLCKPVSPPSRTIPQNPCVRCKEAPPSAHQTLPASGASPPKMPGSTEESRLSRSRLSQLCTPHWQWGHRLGGTWEGFSCVTHPHRPANYPSAREQDVPSPPPIGVIITFP